MPSSWTQRQLGELLSIKHGWAFKGAHFSEDSADLPIVVAIGNFRYEGGFRFGSTKVKRYTGDYPAGYELVAGDILLAMTCQTPGGEILGIPGRIPDDSNTYLHNQRLGLVEVSRPDLVDTEYLYWLFRSASFNRHLVATASGTKILHTAPSRIESYVFELPPLEEQRRIAGVLGALDDKIELNRKMNQTLEEMAQAIFKSWFIDFDGIPPSDLVDSPLGPIPKGWRVEEIGKLVRIVGGATPSTKRADFWDGGTHAWTTPRDLSGAAAPVLTETARQITGAGLSKISSGLLPRGTFLMSSRAPVGYTAIAGLPVAVNQGYIAVPPGGKLSPLYLLHWSRANMQRIKGRAGGTTFQEISKRNFRPMLAVLPPVECLDQFERLVAPVFEKIESNLRESRTLALIRDTLLPKLISGELRVPALEEPTDA